MEYKQFQIEEDRSWSSASSKHGQRSPGQRSFADIVQSAPSTANVVLTGANATPLNPFMASADLNQPVLSGANAIPLGSGPRAEPGLFEPPRSGANTVLLGGTAKTSMRKYVHDRLMFPRIAAHHSLSQSSDKMQDRLCSHCLSHSHWRVNCRGPIRCRACLKPSHIADTCIQFKSPARQQYLPKANVKEPVTQKPGWFRIDPVAQPSSSSSPIFKSFRELSRALWPNKVIPDEVITPWVLRPNNTSWAELTKNTDFYNVLDPRSWLLSTTVSPSSPIPLYHCRGHSVPSEENPTPTIPNLNLPVQPEAPMAFQRADPTPFIPEHLEYVDIPNWRFMVRAVAPFRPSASNENMAIASFNPLPSKALHFPAVRAVFRDFLRNEMRVQYEDIQMTSLWQAMVRLSHAYIRDMLVEDSPHVFDNVTVTFTKHDQGKN